MTDDLSKKMTLEPDNLSEHLHDLAETLSEQDETTLEVEGESLVLHPTTDIDYKIEGATRNASLRGEKESVEISMSWQPPADDDNDGRQF
jgi:amphi-Trp domain-containing protein